MTHRRLGPPEVDEATHGQLRRPAADNHRTDEGAREGQGSVTHTPTLCHPVTDRKLKSQCVRHASKMRDWRRLGGQARESEPVRGCSRASARASTGFSAVSSASTSVRRGELGGTLLSAYSVWAWSMPDSLGQT